MTLGRFTLFAAQIRDPIQVAQAFHIAVGYLLFNSISTPLHDLVCLILISSYY